MKIALPIDETKTNICVSFGRAPYFMIADTEKNTFELIDNAAAEAQGGAGIKAAQIIVDQNAEVLITVRCGENAAEIFSDVGMKIYKAEGADAKANVQAYLDGKLSELTHFHKGFHGIR